ncbi:DUF262 domain-containing protein [Thiomicrorhabdus sp. 6S3-12]|uniref:DUF262 domain-containing protein n=1 Tax=Thiomicrorhabdus sp. 6S3-12 TaxID=2819681 RepID=UPI001AAD6146|nr:DUF262 domain-containing protein [Thiomicrorhabdus sp. 6S3-12]MBO1923778.1 DUF262 domain-containing protein [Thiomicrorhabdus sp. 6S3-12]
MNEHDTVEQVEGLGETDQSESWGDYPLDTVFVRKDVRTVGEVIARIKKDRYILDPEFQRDFVWPPLHQQRLIESALMRIPLPVMYVAEDVDGKIIVVDGLQRLTTFRRYLDDEFALKDIGKKEDEIIKNKRFSELPIHLQERIEDTQLTLYILDSKAPERARLDIFERVNSGEPLTRQQMRNCLYSGQATRWLKKAVELDSFKMATDKALQSKTMRDREVVNRFCAFYLLGIDSYKAEMDDFLSDALVEMNNVEESKLENLLAVFDEVMQLNVEIFDGNAFRKSICKPNGKRSVINASLFDSLVTSWVKHIDNIRALKKTELVERTMQLLIFKPFDDAISLSTNNSIKVRARHSLTEMMFGSHIAESPLVIFYLFILRSHAIYRDENTLRWKANQIRSLYEESCLHTNKTVLDKVGQSDFKKELESEFGEAFDEKVIKELIEATVGYEKVNKIIKDGSGDD